MEIESTRDQSILPKASEESGRTANRLRVQAEVGVIKKRIGNIEEIRAKLGLSRRKICQLLLVDPSAWTRWTSPKSDAPPHIYRALEWYLLLGEKDPRALLPIGSWSTTAFEDRFQSLETKLEKAQVRTSNGSVNWPAIFALLGLILGMVAGYVSIKLAH